MTNVFKINNSHYLVRNFSGGADSGDVSANTSNISNNLLSINTNTGAISTNTGAISTNTTNISDNLNAINLNAANIVTLQNTALQADADGWLPAANLPYGTLIPEFTDYSEMTANLLDGHMCIIPGVDAQKRLFIRVGSTFLNLKLFDESPVFDASIVDSHTLSDTNNLVLATTATDPEGKAITYSMGSINYISGVSESTNIATLSPDNLTATTASKSGDHTNTNHILTNKVIASIDASGNLTFTPNANGQYVINVTASDGLNYGIKPITVNVDINRPERHILGYNEGELVSRIDSPWGYENKICSVYYREEATTGTILDDSTGELEGAFTMSGVIPYFQSGGGASTTLPAAKLNIFNGSVQNSEDSYLIFDLDQNPEIIWTPTADGKPAVANRLLLWDRQDGGWSSPDQDNYIYGGVKGLEVYGHDGVNWVLLANHSATVHNAPTGVTPQIGDVMIDITFNAENRMYTQYKIALTEKWPQNFSQEVSIGEIHFEGAYSIVDPLYEIYRNNQVTNYNVQGFNNNGALSGANPGNFYYSFNQPTIISHYYFRSRNYSSSSGPAYVVSETRAPTDYHMQAFVNNSWQTIHTVTGATTYNQDLYNIIPIERQVKASDYRIRVTATRHGSNYVNITRARLYSGVNDPSPNPNPTNYDGNGGFNP